MQDYYDIPALSQSQIIDFMGDYYSYTNKDYKQPDPRKFWKSTPFNPNREPKKVTAAMTFGKLVHCLLLEPERFKMDFAIFDYGKSTDNKKYIEAIVNYPGKELVTPDMVIHATEMVNQLQKHKMASELLYGATMEEPFFLKSDRFGFDYKGKLDAIKRTPQGIVVIDYKTSNDLDDFRKFSYNRGYHIQQAMYSYLIEKRYGEKPIRFVFIAQSNKEGEEDIIGSMEYLEDRVNEGKHLLWELVEDIRDCMDRHAKGENPWMKYPDDRIMDMK